jgi:hypothetical protein
LGIKNAKSLFHHMNIGLAIWPKGDAEWVELALGSILGSVTRWIVPGAQTNLQPYELFIVDGDNPGASFVSYYKSYTSRYGLPYLIVLGTPMSSALMNLEWEPGGTTFISKPYRIEDIVHATKSKLSLLGRNQKEIISSDLTLAPPPKAPLESETPTAKSLGYLSTLRLPDLIQMLCLSNWTGKIEVTELGLKRQGEIYLNVGVLIHAEQEEKEAEEACYAMLAWGRCEFHFVEEHPPLVQTITSPWQLIMLEGARKQDEVRTG